MSRTKPMGTTKKLKKLRTRSGRRKRLAASAALIDGLRIEPLPKR
jgi:hypothetical protein